MSGYLADTNVLSEPARRRPNTRVLAWLERHESDLYASAFTIAEIAFGIAALPSGRKKQHLQLQLRQLLARMEGRVLPFNKRVALEWGDMQAELRRAGRLMPLEDSLIAATARRYGLDVATRNVDDFHRAGLRVVNPWNAPTRPEPPPAAA
jgi:predicted nucleic acid-binding protein